MAKVALLASTTSCYILLLILLHSASSCLAFTPHPLTTSRPATHLRSSNSNSDHSKEEQDSNSSNNMSDNIKRILVTGANTGIGLALTKQLVADYGCHVYLGSRNAERGARAVEEVKTSCGSDAAVELLEIVSLHAFTFMVYV